VPRNSAEHTVVYFTNLKGERVGAVVGLRPGVGEWILVARQSRDPEHKEPLYLSAF
jgi:hypothetical protein